MSPFIGKKPTFWDILMQMRKMRLKIKFFLYRNVKLHLHRCNFRVCSLRHLLEIGISLGIKGFRDHLFRYQVTTRTGNRPWGKSSRLSSSCCWRRPRQPPILQKEMVISLLFNLFTRKNHNNCAHKNFYFFSHTFPCKQPFLGKPLGII